MKKKTRIILIITGIIVALLIAAGLVTSYIDMARVRNSVEPKYTIKIVTDGENIQITRRRDIEFIVNLLKDSKYIKELCDGINTHKITIGSDVYYLKESCKEIQKGKKQAEISEAELNRFLKMVEDYKNQN